MNKSLKGIVQFFWLFSQLIEFVDNCEFWVNSNYLCLTESQLPSIIIENLIAQQVLSQQENIGFGFWMRYQPFLQIENLNERGFLDMIDSDRKSIQQIGQFVFSITKKNSQQKILIVSQELSGIVQSIVHKVFYNFKNGKNTISFDFDMIGYEGQWILFYLFCNQLEGKTTFGFYQPNLNPISSQVVNDLPEFEIIMIHQSGGLQYYENENQQLIMLNQFKGMISCVLSNGDADFETSIFQCSDETSLNIPIFQEEFILHLLQQGSYDSQYLKEQTYLPQNPQYYLQGWLKLDQIESLELITQLIRITINLDYNDDLILGDRDLLIKYYQNIDPQQNGFEISTYSYTFPLKEIYQTPEELKIKVFGAEYQQAITKWHYIRYEIGTQIENYQPLFQIYFSPFDEIQQFRFPVQVQHFTGTIFLILFGGDEYTHGSIKGQTSGFKINFFSNEPSQELIITCHYSCLKCSGPTKYDCLSCSTESFRELFLLQNTCNCISNYIDVETEMICQLVDQILPQIDIIEIPLDCEIEGYDICDENQIQCSFGYFKNENSCLKCPYYEDINSKIKITCLDCFIYPESFGQTLVCTQEAKTFYQNSENSYQIINKNESEQQHFLIEKTEMGQKTLKICDGCTKTSCKSGYFKRNQKCLKCIDNCKLCENEYLCKECEEKYYLTPEETCYKCQNCNQCKFSEEQGVVCQNCLNGREGFPNYACEDYGSFCDDYDQSLYCNYCVENPKKYYLTFDGKNCSQCNIGNCQYCFQYINMGDYYLTTIDIQFRTYKNFKRDINLGCALCEQNYYFNFNTNKCEIKPQDNDCQFAIIEKNNNFKCIIGSTDNGAVQVPDCSELKFCQQCIKDYLQQLPFCIKCMEGYYAGVLSGQCLPCPKECRSCVQQNIRYKDSWKWDVKAFYKYFVNFNDEHSFEIFATSNNQQEMEIICTSCSDYYILHNQKCILNCAESCQKCEIISDKAICTKCPIYKSVQLKSQDGQGSCIKCPNYCAACIQRSQEEISKINPYFLLNSSDSTNICFEKFIPSDDPDKYFIDTKSLQVKNCQDFKKCQKKVIITNLVYCNDKEFFLNSFADPSLRKTEISILYFFTDFHKQYLESQEVYDYLQEIQPSHLIYEFKFQPDFHYLLCISKFNIPLISVQVMQKIFSIQQLDIRFEGQKNKIKFKIYNKLSLSNFTNIFFQNYIFDIRHVSDPQSTQPLIQFNNFNYNLTLTIKKCIITTNHDQKDFPALFESSHFYSAIIEDVIIEDLKITQSKLFVFNSLNQQNKGKIIIKNLRILNSDFKQSSLFEFNAFTNNFNNEFYAEKVFISNCKFRNSFFLQSKSIQNFNIGDIEIKDINIENSIFQNSSFINIGNARNLIINQLQLNDLILNQNSEFYSANVITIMNSKFDLVKLYNNSKLITNQINLDLNLEEQLNSFITNLEITNAEYDSIQSIISIKQQKKLEFLNIKLTNNYMIGSVNYNQISFSESQIYISCQVCILQNIDVIRLHGLPEISIMESENITMTNINLQQSSEFHPYMLHSDYNCLQELKNFEMSFFIYFGKYQKISLNNIQISETFSFNSPFFIFQGYNLLEKAQDEYITIFDSKFENNLLLLYNEFSSSSILYFESNQNSVIEIENSQFLNNHLNQYYQNIKVVSAAVLVVLQRSGQLNIKNSSFIKNIVTNSTDSILYVQSDSVYIENVTFLKNNLIEYLDFNRNLLIHITNQETLLLNDLENIFPVQSQSGNGVFNVNKFIASNISINQSYAYSAGGFRLIMKGQSIVIIQNSQFSNTRTTLISTIYSQGGCLYLDAQSTQALIFNLSNIQVDTSFSRTEGGGIYVIPSNIQNQIYLKNLTVKNCFAIKNSFLSFQLSKLNLVVSTFFLENSQFFQDELSFNQFLKNLDDFTTFEAETILLQNPLIYTRYGNTSLENCSFVNTYSQFLIFIEESENIILKGLRFFKSTLKKSPLIRLSLRQQQQGLILIKNIDFLQNSQIETPFDIQCLVKQPLILLSQLQCPKNLFSSTYQNFYSRDNEKYLENQLNCNMKLLNNNTDYQISLMEMKNVENIHFIQIQGLKFKDNICKGCYYGLLKVQKINIEMKWLLQINYLEVINNICGYSGCFSFLGKSQSNPYRSDLISNRILQSQELKNYKEIIKYDLLIEDSIFLNNTAQFGGAVMIIEAQSLILNSQFQFNTAKIGGAIYFFADSSLLILILSKVTHNSALIAGGIFLNNQSLQELHQLSVEISENNSTGFGSDIIESPRSLSLIVSQNLIQFEKKTVEASDSQTIEKIIVRPYKTVGYEQKLQFLTMPSGRSIDSYYYFDSQQLYFIPYNLTFRIIPLNKFNQQLKGLDGRTCKITPVSINSISNENVTDKFYDLSYYSTLYNKETQDFNFDDLIIYFNPNYDDNIVLRLIIECDFIKIPVYDKEPPFLIIDYVKNYQLWVDIKTYKCQLGEYLNVTSGGCVLCDSFQNQYQVSQNAFNCSYKDDQKMKSIESSMIELRPHYWRAYYYSSTIEHCYHLEENCLGGWIPGDNSCVFGHIGALCEQCDLYNLRGDGSFSVSSKFSCGSCEKIATNIISIILISFWTLISTLMSVSSTVQMMEEFIIELKFKQFGITIGIKAASTAILIKIVTNYLQIITTMSTFQLEIPIGFQTVFNSLGNPIEQMAYSLDCFLISISNIDIIYFRIIWSLLITIFYIIIFLLLGLISRLIVQIKFSISHVSTALLYIFIFMQPSLIQGLISLLSYRIISNEYWIQGNVVYRYDTVQHSEWSLRFCFPLLIFIGIVLPFLFWFGLFKNRNNLDKIIVRRIWGYLYNEYKKQLFYWEIIKILQKELIIIVLVYYDDYIPIKASLVFIILFGYSYLTQESKPYATGELNYVDSQSTIVCATSIILGSSIFSAQQNNFKEIVWPFYLVIALLNMLFVTKIILKICYTYYKIFSELIDKVKQFIKSKILSVLVLHPSLDKLFELNSEKQARIKQKYQKIRQKFLPQIKKWLIFKRLILSQKNNLKWSVSSEGQTKQIKINQFEEFQILKNQVSNFKDLKIFDL